MVQVIPEVPLAAVVKQTLMVLRHRSIPMILVCLTATLLSRPVHIGVLNTVGYGVADPTLFYYLNQGIFEVSYWVLTAPAAIFVTRVVLDWLRSSSSSAEEHLEDFQRHYLPVLAIWVVTGVGYALSHLLPPLEGFFAWLVWSGLSMWFMCAVAVRLAEDRSVIVSLRISLRLVRGNFRALFGVACSPKFCFGAWC